jgi:hypothetical protein
LFLTKNFQTPGHSFHCTNEYFFHVLQSFLYYCKILGDTDHPYLFIFHNLPDQVNTVTNMSQLLKGSIN